MSEMRYRDVGWSVQSRTRSYFDTISSAFSEVKWVLYVLYLTKGLRLYEHVRDTSTEEDCERRCVPLQILDSAVHFGHAHSKGRVSDLTMEVRRLDDVAVHEAQCADAGAGKVSGGGAAKATGTDDENGRISKPQLTCIS